MEMQTDYPKLHTKCYNAINAATHAIQTQQQSDYDHAERCWAAVLTHVEPEELSDIEQ